MQKQIIYRPKYISLDDVQEIRDYFNNINDDIRHSRGPYNSKKNKLGWQGCWDRQLHYELPDNPIHKIVEKLKNDFGDFEIYESSIRYLSSPFLPHSDIRSLEWIQELRKKNLCEGFIFLIPLWWKNGYEPGTAFFNCPANLNDPFYTDFLDILPKYSDEYSDEMKNFSVRELVKWNSPGDLIVWENFQWHSSCHFSNIEYSRDHYVKEFISIETSRRK